VFRPTGRPKPSRNPFLGPSRRRLLWLRVEVIVVPYPAGTKIGELTPDAIDSVTPLAGGAGCFNASAMPWPTPMHMVQRARLPPVASCRPGSGERNRWTLQGYARTVSLRTFAPTYGIQIMATGTVKWFNAQKGFGFIQPDGGGKDVFVHISAVERAGLQGLNEGQKISYDVQNERGKDAAVNLKA
jgi:CspA family cold shock protein